MSATRLAKTAIKIPSRIHRGPTDILKALASTVKHLPNEPEHIFQDDCYLLPSRNLDRKQFALAKISGIETAQYFLNKYPELFYRDDAEPKIKAYMPADKLDPSMDLNEADLKQCINDKDTANAIITYEALTEKGITISNECQMDFFEMLCYTGAKPLPTDLELEKLRLLRSDELKDKFKAPLEESSLVFKLFDKLIATEGVDQARVYSAMIAGLVRNRNKSASFDKFADFQTYHEGLGLSPIAYEALIDSIPDVYRTMAPSKGAVVEVIQHMSKNHVKPTLGIFNAILRCYRGFICDDVVCRQSFEFLNDMTRLGITPSASTWASMITIVSRYKSGTIYGSFLRNMINCMDPNQEILDEDDATGFTVAMRSITNNMGDLDLAHSLHMRLLGNATFFKDHYLKNRYYNHYFNLILHTDNLKNALDFYRENVPFSFEPTVASYEKLVDELEIQKASEDDIKMVGLNLIHSGLYKFIKSDDIFRTIPEYVENIERIQNAKEGRARRSNKNA